MLALIPWVAGVAGAAVAGLGLMLWISETRLDNAIEDIAELKQEKSEWVSALAECKVADHDNQKAIQECRQVNEDNEKAAAKMFADQQKALASSKARDTETDRRVVAMRKKQETQDEDCRKLDEPLPDWFIAGLRRDHP